MWFSPRGLVNSCSLPFITNLLAFIYITFSSTLDIPGLSLCLWVIRSLVSFVAPPFYMLFSWSVFIVKNHVIFFMIGNSLCLPWSLLVVILHFECNFYKSLSFIYIFLLISFISDTAFLMSVASTVSLIPCFTLYCNWTLSSFNPNIVELYLSTCCFTNCTIYG